MPLYLSKLTLFFLSFSSNNSAKFGARHVTDSKKTNHGNERTTTKMQNPIATTLSTRVMVFLCALLFFSTSVLASPYKSTPGTIKLIARQADAAAPAVGSTLTRDQACQQYSRIANLSAIGTNSSYRTAFLESSPVGTLFNAAMLNGAMANLPPLTADAALNAACGNLTTIATEQAAVNFTQGIVAQFTFTGNPSAIVNGPIMIGVTLFALVVICGPLSAL